MALSRKATASKRSGGARSRKPRATPRPSPPKSIADAEDRSPLVVWAVSDGRAGIESQVLGLAEAIGRLTPIVLVRKHVRFTPGYDRLPSALKLAPRRFLAAGSDRIDAPWPDLWIGAGRASIPFALRLRRWSKGRTFVVQAQNPRWPARLFDLVAPPRHDGLSGPNVVAITGSPHRVTPERLAAELKPFARALKPLPSPRVAMLVGGKSKAHDLSAGRAATMADQIAGAVREAGGSLLLTFSRRTPEAAKAAMVQRLEGLPGVIWDGEGPNPYFAFLAAADHILVTEDSANMATEAASTGKPVQVLKMDGRSRKLRRLHDELEALGAARPFAGTLETWAYAPLRETDRLARQVLDRLRRRDPLATERPPR